MRIVGLDHVQLAMPRGREDEARAFYGGVLGLVEVAKPPPLAARGGCWFEGGAHLHLSVVDDFRPARKAHPGLLVADLAAARAAFAAAEVAWIEDDAHPGVEHIYVQDPFGNRLEILEPKTGERA